MAGNIIPAIATTNACVAGMVLVEALKIVRGEMDKCRWVRFGLDSIVANILFRFT
jgi:ubiquitin-like 1-activating enzyme E1 B